MIKKVLFGILFGLLLGGVTFSQFSFADLSFSDKFGSTGNDDDEFDQPTDLAITEDGKNLYVVDSKNDRIKMYELTDGSNCPSGTDEIVNDEVCFDDSFGSTGSSTGRFDIPTDLAIDKSSGDIYVVDSDNNRVQRFQDDGDYDNLEFGSSDSNDNDYLGSPSAIAIHSSSDNIYVADSTTDSISVFSDNGNFLFKFGDTGSGNDEFRDVSGMIIDDDDDILYVADTRNDRIQMYELTDGSNCPSGTDEIVNDEVCFVDNFGSSGDDDGRFDEPAGLAFDEDDKLLYVADTENDRIQVFEIVSGNTCPSGTNEIIDGVCFVEEYGSSGTGNGDFNSPSGLALDTSNDLLYVADTDNNRVQILETSGNSSVDNISFSDKFGSTGNDDDEFDQPTDLAITEDGKNLYVVDSKNDRIKMYELTDGSNCPSGTDEIVNDEVCFDDSFGSTGSSTGRFDIPTDLAIDKSSGDIYVVDSDNNRVQRFQDDGDYDNLEFGSSDSNDNDYLGSPSAIAIHSSSDNIYVADSTTDSISVFSDNGNFLFKFGDTGSGNDEFRDVSGMIIDDDDDILYVADTRNDRIQMYELTDGSNCPSGTDEIVNDEVCFVDNFGSSGDDDGRFDEPAGLAFDEDDKLLYVADTENDRIQVFEIVSGNTCPSGTNEIIDGVCFVEEYGSSGTGNGDFNSPSGLALDTSNDLLYVADTDNNRVQILALPQKDSSGSNTGSSSSSSKDAPEAPKGLSAFATSPTSITITWDAPEVDKDIPKITGYKIEYKLRTGSYTTITQNTGNDATSFVHKGLDNGENYFYRIYAINSEGTSKASSIASAKPEHTTTPNALTATAISPSQIKLFWQPPSNTFGQSISGYDIKREVITGVYDVVGSTNGKTTSFIVSNLATDKTYTYAVSAIIGFGDTGESNTASATPREDSVGTTSEPTTSTAVQITVPTPPIKLTTSIISATQVNLAWSSPVEDGNSPITGYKIEVKKDSGSYATLIADTESTTRTYTHTNLSTNSKYTYKVSAINSAGTSDSSNEASATPRTTNLQISPMGKLTIDEGRLLSFAVKLTDNSIKNAVFSLDKNPPQGAKIISNTGMFSWTPSASDGGKTYSFEVVVRKDAMSDRETITIGVNDVLNSSSSTKEPEPPQTTTNKPAEIVIPAPFVDATKDPQSYVDRYTNEQVYKDWFDKTYPEYDSIYQAVGLDEPLKIPAPFVDATKDPQSYVDRYTNEQVYKDWFDKTYPEYDSIYQAVGLDEPKVEQPKAEEKKFGICGPGTSLIDGVCTIIKKPVEKPWWQFW